MTNLPAPSVDFSVRCETRAVEEGHRAFVNDDGSVRVVSESSPGTTYRVTFVAPIADNERRRLAIEIVVDRFPGDSR